MKDNWYRLLNESAIDSPSLLVFPARVKQNISRMVEMTGNVSRLRPHVKTHKTMEGVRMMMDEGISKFKCATISEAEMLALCDAPDVLLAYQPVGPKIKRLAELISKYPQTKFSCLVDNRRPAEEMSEVFVSANMKVEVYIDLNVGMNRTGISPGPEAYKLFQFCAISKGLKPVGLHAYDGHFRDPDFTERKAACEKAFESVVDLQNALVDIGFERPLIIAGGTPTFPVHAAREEAECSPGTCIFWDKGYSDLCREQPFEPATILITRIISLPAPNRITLDLGHKSVAAENEISKRVYFHDAPELTPVSQSEEHLVMEVTEGHQYRVGDLLYGIPFHICPTVALYDKLVVIENGTPQGTWKVIARDRSISV
jgi:D-serine deaminase-like pyridoxal phosphate-dependent protein